MKSVGEVLSGARKKQGKNIVQVEEATRIPAKYIKALEGNQFDVIPGDVYVKGFLHTYASYLGLDSSELIAEYKQSRTPPPPAKKERRTPVITSAARRTSKRRWGAFLVAVLIIAVLAGLSWLGSVEKKPIKVLSGKAKQKETGLKKEKEPEPEPSAEQQAAPLPASAVTIRVKAIGRYACSMRVVVDGTEAFEGILEPGEEKEWKGNQSILVRTTNPRGLRVTQNGQDIGVFSQGSGRVAERTFTPN